MDWTVEGRVYDLGKASPELVGVNEAVLWGVEAEPVEEGVSETSYASEKAGRGKLE